MDALPLEIVQHIFKFVITMDLHRLALVSTRTRIAALSDDRFSITCRITDNSDMETSCSILEYAATHAVPITFRIGHRDGFRYEAHVLRRLTDLLIRAFPLVVRLIAAVPPYIWNDLKESMCGPAPSLLFFSLNAPRQHVNSTGQTLFELPKNLFGRLATRLSFISISNVEIQAGIPVALQSTKRVFLGLGVPATIFVARDFPSAEHITFHVRHSYRYFGLDCRGAGRLQQLDLISIGPIRTISIAEWERLCVMQIPAVAVDLSVVEFPGGEHHPLLKGLSGPLTVWTDILRARVVVSAHQAQKKKQLTIYCCPPFENNTWNVFNALRPRLADVDIDSRYLSALLGEAGGSLPELTLLRVRGVLRGSEFIYRTQPGVRCDKLTELVLVDGVNPIDRDYATELARTLGQDVRPVHERARLELVGKVYSRLLLEDFSGIFSSISRY